jgi:hypothetical protein
VIKSKRIRWAEHLESIENMRKTHIAFVVTPEEKGQLGRCRRVLEDNIKMDHRIHPAQVRIH